MSLTGKHLGSAGVSLGFRSRADRSSLIRQWKAPRMLIGIDRSATLCRRRAKGVQMQNSPDGEEVIDELGEEVIDEFGRSIFQTVSDEEMKEYDQTEPGILENESFATFLRVAYIALILGGIVFLGYLARPVIDVSISTFPGAQ